MPNGETHKLINFVVGAGASTYLYFVTGIAFPILAYNILDYLIGTLVLNPDLDTNSRPRNKFGILGFIWRPFSHRGVLHNPLLYLIIMGIFHYFNKDVYFLGITASALLHILCDWIMDLIHKIPGLKNV